MAKTIFEQTGGAYSMQGDYCLPALILPLADVEEEAHLLFLRMVKDTPRGQVLPNNLKQRVRWRVDEEDE